MDKLINKILSNTLTRSLSILIFILVFASIGYFTVVNAQTYSEYGRTAFIDGALVVFGNNLPPGTNESFILQGGNMQVVSGKTKLNKLEFISSNSGNNSTLISHYEVDDSGVAPDRWAIGYSDCNPVAEGSKDNLPVRLTSADFNNQTLLHSRNPFNDIPFFGFPTAQADDFCFLLEDDCEFSGLGCVECVNPPNAFCTGTQWYCQRGSGGGGCDPFDCHDAACGPGWSTSSPSLIQTDFCSGESPPSFNTKMRCKSDTVVEPHWLEKMEFRGSPDTNQPTEVEIFDNLIADENVPSGCGWQNGVAGVCTNGKFLAGWRSATPQLHCCEL